MPSSSRASMTGPSRPPSRGFRCSCGCATWHGDRDWQCRALSEGDHAGHQQRTSGPGSMTPSEPSSRPPRTRRGHGLSPIRRRTPPPQPSSVRTAAPSFSTDAASIAAFRTAEAPVYAALEADPATKRAMAMIRELAAGTSSATVMACEPVIDVSTLVPDGGDLPNGIYRVEYPDDYLKSWGLNLSDANYNHGLWTYTLEDGHWTIDQHGRRHHEPQSRGSTASLVMISIGGGTTIPGSPWST